MLQKALLYSALALALLKFVFRLTPREIGRRIDRWVNPILIALLVAYGAHVAWWLIKGR